jgi:hypothetical protein
MVSPFDGHVPEVRVRRYADTAECDVVVFFREQTMVLRCRDYSQAVKWAHIECKSYKIPGDFTVERVEAQQPNNHSVEE